MALKILLSHKTTYHYDKLVSLSPHVIRLRPAPHSRTPIESYSLKITPEEKFLNWQQDPFGNYLARVVFPKKTKELSIEVEIIADMKVINPFDFFVESYAECYPFDYTASLAHELQPYLECDDVGELFETFVSTVERTKTPIVDFLVGLNLKIYNFLTYTIRLEPGVQSCEETLTLRRGSCRDYAWLMVQTLRRLGLAARFVSGYLVQLRADVESLDGPSGPSQDFTDLHAWCEVYIPGAGWIGLDATSGLFAGEGHIPLACTPHFQSASPVEGMSDICTVTFDYSNHVTRLFESPRVTKPYTEHQWQEIYDTGFLVDAALEKGDVRLTMGGEPTFVSIDDMEGEEWTTKADGEKKRVLANTLAFRLREVFGKGGLLHQPQGKWYPGEPLPRWCLNLFWRKDGSPIWKNSDLLARSSETLSYSKDDAFRFLETLSLSLGVSPANIHPAYEDALYTLWEESRLPVDCDIQSVSWDDPLSRQKLAQTLVEGIATPRGFVLPLGWGMTRWITSGWDFRLGKLYLLPGNSPIGLRLPLESLSQKPHAELEQEFHPDLFSPSGVLGDFHEGIQERFLSSCDHKDPNYSVFVRTALCVEEREGKIYIFLPPLSRIEPFLDLIASVEWTAQRLGIKVILEGYEPPKDNRIEKLAVTPDPGVIEVNIHPSGSWHDLVSTTITLYDEARLSRLGTQKFMLDGNHSGTGGGNHVTIGGWNPSDSPLLRRPDLLRSLITFWQHHPSLSYLFSGAFVGPTSQAPRVDEGCVENLYELEIAFSQIPKGDVPFWLTDRLFRHLLTDLTGNTHRSELCIDKLYSPDSVAGRLGILEFRGFEMPPHPQMSLVQMLLIRALVAVFWEKPYEHQLIRWGTRLHDQFLIEHFVREDLKDVVAYLQHHGFPLQVGWFDPFFEFRFPLYGMIEHGALRVELRGGIEPWNVLGEEMTTQGTSRYVDSSIERVQVKVSHFCDERYRVACNGVKVPLLPTGCEGEYVAGIRYKAWQPWSALHPTIGVDTPLVFEVIDTWNGCVVAGCTYFVSHPGGRNYEVFPVNSYEAEARRINRFWDIPYDFGDNRELFVQGETQRSVRNIQKFERRYTLQELPQNKEYPTTLDMRSRWKPLV